jgi:hypothetical protein
VQKTFDQAEGPDEVDELTGKLAKLDSQVKNLAAAFDGDDDVAPEIADKVRAKHAERRGTIEALAKARAKAASPISGAWAEAKNLLVVLDQAEDQDDVRTRLRAALRRVVNRIDCVFRASSGRRRLAHIDLWYASSTVVIPGSSVGGNRRSLLVMVGADGEVRARSVGLWTPAEWSEAGGDPHSADWAKWIDAVDLAKLWGTLNVVVAPKVTPAAAPAPPTGSGCSAPSSGRTAIMPRRRTARQQ